MMPEFLARFKDELKKYEREVIRIEATPLGGSPTADQLSVSTSKFLGRPFFSVGEEYPMDKMKKPMLLAAQINFGELPDNNLFPSDGLLQLFLSSTEWYEDGYKIIYRSAEELARDAIEDFSFLSNADYEACPIFQIHALKFRSDMDRGGSEDAQFDCMFEGQDYWEFYEQLPEKHQNDLEKFFDADGHKMGGYAAFTQSDPRDYDRDRRSDVQLLQIDTDEHIMFGDAGIAHVFIHPDDLAAKKFENAYFYWDCC